MIIKRGETSRLINKKGKTSRLINSFEYFLFFRDLLGRSFHYCDKNKKQKWEMELSVIFPGRFDGLFLFPFLFFVRAGTNYKNRAPFLHDKNRLVTKTG